MPAIILKRIMLILIGPAVFGFIAAAPVFCGKRRGFRGWYWRRIRRACALLMRLLSIRVEISEDARQALAGDTGSVIAVNHRSHLDGFALMSALPDEKWVTFGAKKELCDAPLLRRGFAGAGLVEIDRKSGKVAVQTMIDAVRAMPARRSMILFAEGTRSRGAGLGEFKAGVVLCARATGRVVRPIVISNADALLPRGAVFPKSGTIRIDALPPLEMDLDASVDEDVARLRDAMVTAFEAGAR